MYEGIICVSPESGEWRESHLVLSRNALLEIGSFRDGEWRTKAEYYSEHWTLIQEQLSLGGQFFWEISDPLGELDIKEVVTFGIKVSIHETSGNSRNYNSIWVTILFFLFWRKFHFWLRLKNASNPINLLFSWTMKLFNFWIWQDWIDLQFHSCYYPALLRLASPRPAMAAPNSKLQY